MKAFIFDLDGVLVSTDHFHYLAWKQIADKLGLYFDETINNRLRGVSRMESLEIVLEKSQRSFTQQEKEQLAEEKNTYYKQLLQQMTPEYVDSAVRSTLNALRNRGYKLSIGSSSKNTRFILSQVDLLDQFDAVSDGTNITKSKPDPEVFLKAAEFLGVNPRDCVVVEDATAGVDAAKAADMLVVGIGDAASYARADFSIRAFKDLLDLDCAH